MYIHCQTTFVSLSLNVTIMSGAKLFTLILVSNGIYLTRALVCQRRTQFNASQIAIDSLVVSVINQMSPAHISEQETKLQNNMTV